MLGTDLGALAPATLDAVGNRDVIAVDQDALGRQATRVADDGAHSVWVKPLARGDLAVALLNTSDSAATLSTTLSAIGAATGPWRTHDLWSGTRSMTSDRLSARVQPHGMALFRLSRP
jgi:alpha-galactosidase